MKKRQKPKARIKVDPYEKRVPEWYVNADFEAASQIVEKHGINGTGIPDEADILRRAEAHHRNQRKLDRDAAAWAYKSLLEVSPEGDLTALITDVYTLRPNTRAYTTRAPFSAILIARFQYDEHRASKIAVYLRAALHKGWSVPDLRREMKARWYLKPSAEEAQKYLQEQGEIKKRNKRSLGTVESTQASDTKAGPLKPGEQEPDDDMIEDPLDEDIDFSGGDLDDEKNPGADNQALRVQLTVPAEFVQHLRNGKSIYPKLVKAGNGEVLATRWYIVRDLRRRFSQPAESRQQRRATKAPTDRRGLTKLVEKLRQRARK